MQPPYHPLLLQQIQASLGSTDALPAPWLALLRTISDAYAQRDAALQAAQAQVAHRTEQLISSTSRAYSFLDSIHKGFMMCDTTGEVVLTNDSWRQMLASKATPEGTPSTASSSLSTTIESIDALFRPELPLRDLVKQCLATAEPLERDEVNFGTRVLRLDFAPLVSEPAAADKQLLGVVILAEDITEQKVLERSKDEFLSIASHELRTPLTAIRGNAALIKKYYADSITNQDMAEMIDDIHDSSVRLIGIVNDFLDVAAMEQGKISMQPEVFALGDVVGEVVRELEHLCADKGIALVNDPSVAAAPPVRADKQRIKQVIINLVGNAVKFTDNGSITISTRPDETFVYTTVTDTGSGMSEENQKLLFRKFQQAGSSLLTRSTSKGTGLGLYISKLIIELSGGKIGLERSVLGQGSAFTFSLLRAESSPVPASEKP